MAEYKIQEAARIKNLILTLRGLRVMLDADLAKIYGVTTKQLNQQFKRNGEWFPDDFAFVLDEPEAADMRSQNVTSSRRNLRRAPAALQIGFMREKTAPYRATASSKKRF